MCLLCIQITKETMTTQELGRAISEFEPQDEDHWEEINSLVKQHYDEQDIIEELWKEYAKRLD